MLVMSPPRGVLHLALLASTAGAMRTSGQDVTGRQHDAHVCVLGARAECPEDRLVSKSAECRTTSAAGPLTVGSAAMGLPPQLQGLFWLQHQGKTSALMSFATSRDGGMWSKLNLSATDKEHFHLRYPGDKVWSFHTQSGQKKVSDMHLIYHFQFEDENGKVPTKPEDIVAAQIIPENFGPIPGKVDPWFMSFRMRLDRKGEVTSYPGSTVWIRDSGMFGTTEGYRYDLVQIIDGEGNKLEPAFSEWVEYCENPFETGLLDKGRHWYYEVGKPGEEDESVGPVLEFLNGFR